MADQLRAAVDAPPDSSGWSLSLVIPAYNEVDCIAQAVIEADDALGRICTDHEILVVDDGSSDGTAEAVLAVARSRPSVRLVHLAVNQGYGAALRKGFEYARYDHVAFTDADCQFDLADLARLLPATRRVPIVVGYRAARQDPWKRRLYSWGYNRLVRLLLGTGVRDCDCALKVFRRDALASLLPETERFFVNAEMLTRARQQGLAVEEVAVRHRPRARGTSKVSLLDVPRTLATLLPFWWSRVLFPRDDAPPSALKGEASGARGLLLAILVAAALLFFWHLDSPLQEPDEARYAEVPRQMLAETSWVVPVLHGQPYYDKPPLFYWLVMGCYRLCGVHDWAARLASSGSAFLVVPLIYWWGRRVLGERAALAGALVLALSGRFVYLGRLLTPDSLLTLCVVGTLAAGHVAVAGTRLRRGWWLLSAVACGLGMLTKGPVALVLGLVPILMLQLLDPRAARPRWRSWMAFCVVALVVAAPWYIAVAVKEPGFLEYFFWRHNFVRYVAPFDHAEPFWFHVPGLVLGMLPWTLLLPGLVRLLVGGSRRAAQRRPAGLGYCLLASLWGLIFYSVSGSKRAVYILPVLPPLALALGCYLDLVLPRARLVRGGLALWSYGSRLSHAATMLMLALAAAGALLAIRGGLLRPQTGGLLAGAAALSVGALWSARGNAGRGASWAACGGTTFVLLFVAMHQLQPGYARRFSLRGHILPHARETRAAVACYPRQWDSVGFYLSRNDVRAYGREERDQLIADLHARRETLLFVKSGHDLEELLRDLPESLEFVPSALPGLVTVGRVRARTPAEAPEQWLARR